MAPFTMLCKLFSAFDHPLALVAAADLKGTFLPPYRFLRMLVIGITFVA